MNRIAIASIIIEDKNQVEAINAILHQYGEYMVGRMGIPYKARKINIISVVLDAPNNIISAMSGKLGALSGVTSKTIYSKEFPDE
ncbi:MAG: TM1266 family iron-only hydrogenase system putative regulator [Clostridia bacterium]